MRADANIDLAGPAHQLKAIPIWQSPFGAQTYMLPAVVVLSAMGALLLLIVCANVAGLVLARGISRRGEVALRLALGASRARILWLLLVENFLSWRCLAALAGRRPRFARPRACRLLMAAHGHGGSDASVFQPLGFDPLVIGFSVLAAFASALVFGLFPALRHSRVDLLSVMKEDLSARGAAKGRFRAGLIVSQVAVSLLLLIGAGLVTRSVDAARNADASRIRCHQRGLDAARCQAERLRRDARPRVFRSAAGTRSAVTPVRSRRRWRRPLHSRWFSLDNGARQAAIDGYVPRRDEDLTFLSNVVAPDYFRTLKIGFCLPAGREFEESRRCDRRMPVAIVNETAAGRFWGGAADAVGKRIRVGDGRVANGDWRGARTSNTRGLTRPRGHTSICPFCKPIQPSMVLHARGSAGVAPPDRAQVRAHVQTLDPDLPILSAGTLSEADAF